MDEYINKYKYINYEQLGHYMFIIKGFRLTVLDMEEAKIKTIDIRQIERIEVIALALAIHHASIGDRNEIKADSIFCIFKEDCGSYFKERVQDIKSWLERLIKEYQY